MKEKAIVFAGQGAQAVGMGKDLADTYPECKALFDKADEVLGFKLSKLCFEGPIEELTKSSNCQPAIFVSSIACWKMFSSKVGNVPVKGTAGLSLGEWSALHMAGALTFEDTLRVLQARGRFMQEACEEKKGGMVSVIGLVTDKLRDVCAKTGVEIANLNSPEQTVLSGERQAIEAAERLAKEAGAKKTVILNVAGAFHSKLMVSAAGKLKDFLIKVEISQPKIPVVANATGMPHGAPDDIRREMVRQVTSSVQWVSCVNWFRNNGVTEYVECGPGRVLTGLIKRIDSSAVAVNIQDIVTLNKAVTTS
ncbi:MAG: ACP S-malonyltransferase [Kiritimatiellae bacterium]|nr:ACP S-malonyltransferase [Kiritimatiellia bacterium]